MVSLVTAVRDLNRLREIYMVLVRHGFGELASRLGLAGKRGAPPAEEQLRERGEEARRRASLAERVRLVAQDLGPSFVKLGQIASTRPDVLPLDLVGELKKLQDEVPPLPYPAIREAIEASLGAPLDELFESFDETPVAAASIGQVHRAVLRHPEGSRPVCVKVQRPGAAATVARDLELLHGLARLVERTVPESHVYSPSGLVLEFDRAITSELDFAQEADNARRFQQNFEGWDHVRFPHIYREASSKTVLTLEWLDGRKVYEAIREQGFHGPTIARRAVAVVIKMIFEDGFFHADPHPGNLLIMGTPEAPVLGLIDLGMVGRLSPEMRDKTVDMMIAAVRKDHVALADALYAIGTPTKKVDMRAYRAEVARLAEKYLGRPLREIELSSLIRDLVRGATRFGLEIPPDFLMVGKAMMTIEGIGKEIDPELDVVTEIRPYFLELLRKRYSPERIGAEVWRGIERFSGAAYDLPVQVREILDDLRLGRLTLRSSDPSLPGTVDRLGRRIFSGLLVSAFVVAGAWLLAREVHGVLGYTLLGFGLLFLVAHVLSDLRRR